MSPSAQLRDAAIAADIRDTLATHTLLQHCRIDLDVRGGVAHVRGAVDSARQRDALRGVIGRVRGVNAVWELLRLHGGDDLRVIDIGCGNRKQVDAAIGVDCHRLDGVDVVARIERGLPFAADTADLVYAIHFLEHLDDLLPVMNEVHRVLKPGGVLHVMVPNWESVNALADPTHRRLFHRQTFKFFCRAYPGLCAYRPLHVSASAVDLFADLQPIKDGEAANSEQLVARFFD